MASRRKSVFSRTPLYAEFPHMMDVLADTMSGRTRDRLTEWMQFRGSANTNAYQE